MHERRGVDGRSGASRARAARQLAAARRHGPHRRRSRRPIEDDPAAFYGPLVTATFATQLRAAMPARGCGSDGRAGRACACSTSVPAGRRGRSPCSSSRPGSTAVVNDLPRRDRARRARRSPSAALTDRVELAPATSTRSTSSRARSTSSCSATCAAPRATHGAQRADRAGVRRAAPGGQAACSPTTSPTTTASTTRSACRWALTMLATTERGAHAHPRAGGRLAARRRLRARSACSSRSGSTTCSSRRPPAGESRRVARHDRPKHRRGRRPARSRAGTSSR